MIKRLYGIPLYTLFHPVDGFYEMKHEKKGKRSIMIINLLLFWISFSFQKQYTGFVMNENYPFSFNTFMDLLGLLLFFILWCVGNWSVTTLMGGEGKIKEIAMATAYALTPMILVFIPATIISNFMINTEKEFYFMLLTISIVWFSILLFIGIMSVHDYSVTKTVATIVLTFASMLVILFIILLMTMLVQQMYIFIRSIYIELIYRV